MTRGRRDGPLRPRAAPKNSKMLWLRSTHQHCTHTTYGTYSFMCLLTLRFSLAAVPPEGSGDRRFICGTERNEKSFAPSINSRTKTSLRRVASDRMRVGINNRNGGHPRRTELSRHLSGVCTFKGPLVVRHACCAPTDCAIFVVVLPTIMIVAGIADIKDSLS